MKIYMYVGIMLENYWHLSQGKGRIIEENVNSLKARKLTEVRATI